MNDYIKRKDALDIIISCGRAHRYDDNPCITYTCDNLERQITGIPVADAVERKRGHDTGESRVFRCSECGYGINDIFEDMDSPALLYERFKTWNFCPNCGVDLREVDT